ncbi:MAG TPA: ABC transporter permease [Gemmatimonadales bacterium]|jgi:putative ABC transport system permease protein
MNDFRYALRQLFTRPGFTTAAVLTLSLGIGATTALFTVVNSVLLQPLPYPESQELQLLYAAYPERGSNRGSLSVPDFEDWTERSGTLESAGLFTTLPSDLVLGGRDRASELNTVWASWGLLATLGVQPALGRLFRGEDETGDPFVVVLSHGLWSREFGRDSAIVGRTLTLSDKSFEVVGVMPPGFGFPTRDADVWALLTTIRPDEIPMHLRYVRFLNAVGRLAPGATPEQAREELSAIALALSREYPDANEGLEAADMVALRDAVIRNVETALLILLGAVGLVLLIASVNVANLLLAKGAARSRELAVRAALGANRARVVRMLLTESAVLGLLGAAAGVVFAFWGVELIVSASAGIIPRAAEVRPDGWVLAFALGVSALSVAVFGLIPAWSAVKTDPARHLIGIGGDRGATRQRGRGALVVAEVAVALVLLVGAGLLIRSLWTLADVEPGFRPERALAVTLTIPASRYPERADYLGQHQRLLDQFRAIPGVETVGSIRYLPMRGDGEQWRWHVVGEPEPPPSEWREAQSLQVTEDLFRSLGVPLLAGRSVSDRDPPEGPLVLVVNQAFAHEAFGGGEAVGRAVRVEGLEATVIGVVGNVRQESLDEAPVPTLYIPQHQIARRGMAFVLRTRGDPLALAGAVRSAVRLVDPDQAITELTSLAAVLHESIARPRFFAILLSLFAGLAVTLAAIGIHGVLAFSVRQRTREIGIRTALGAARGETLRLVVQQGLRPALLGVAIGLVAAAALTRLMTRMLFEVQPLDPVTYAAVVVIIGLVALAACGIPAWRATRVHPMEALRYE